jgi:hypothetical protein
MNIPLAEYHRRFPDRPKPIPFEYAGLWIAWNADRTAIVAHGPDMIQVRDNAVSAGHTNPVLQKVPRGPFVGGIYCRF